MNRFIPGFLGMVLAGLGLALMSAGIATAQDASARTLTVTGEGIVAAAPDMATLRLGVLAQEEEAAAAMAAVSERMRAVLARLEAAGIAAADVQTSTLALSPEWEGPRPGDTGLPRIARYTASNLVSVRVRDLDTLGAVLDAVLTDGANRLDGLAFAVADAAPLRDEARRRAVADGRARAELFAEAAGVELGPLMRLDEAGSPRGFAAMEMSRAASDGGMPVAPGEVTMEARVNMVFEIR
jgi:uncharacterized protein YggE